MWKYDTINKLLISNFLSDAASITKITPDTTYDPGATATLTCEADANPSTSSMVSWQRAGYALDSGRVSASATDTSATLIVANVAKVDTGEFVCEVSNGIGKKTNGSSYLIVKCE